MEVTIKLAGVIFGGAQDNIKMFGCPGILTYALIREPDNPHDPNAIRVTLIDKWFMGYCYDTFESITYIITRYVRYKNRLIKISSDKP